MKKNITLLLIVSMLLALGSNAVALPYNFSEYPHLYVYNDWFEPIQVKEGHWKVTESLIIPGNWSSQTLRSYFITDLSITYQNNGVWQQIPGCSRGDYGYVFLKVYIVPSEINPKIPKCVTEIWPIVPISD